MHLYQHDVNLSSTFTSTYDPHAIHHHDMISNYTIQSFHQYLHCTLPPPQLQEGDGLEHVPAADLRTACERSQLSSTSFTVQQSAGPGANFNHQQHYSAWSGKAKLTNTDPPLLQEWSNPKKVRLTPEGVVLARCDMRMRMRLFSVQYFRAVGCVFIVLEVETRYKCCRYIPLTNALTGSCIRRRSPRGGCGSRTETCPWRGVGWRGVGRAEGGPG